MKRSRVVFRDGTLGLWLRGEVYYVVGRVGDKRIRVSAKTNDLRQAKDLLYTLRTEAGHGWREDLGDADDLTWRAVAHAAMQRQKWAAKRRGIPFNLTARAVYDMMRQTGFRCSVSGVPFSRAAGDAQRNPWAVSIDRIDARRGYDAANVRIVCCAANIAMADWGYDVLLALARGVINSSRLVSQEPAPPDVSQTIARDPSKDALSA